MMMLASCGNNTSSSATTNTPTTGTSTPTTVNYGTLESPLSVETFKAEVAKLGLTKDTFSEKHFFVTGKLDAVSSSYDTLEGNVRVSGFSLDTDVVEPYQNDTIVVEGLAKCTTNTAGDQTYYNIDKNGEDAPTIKSVVRGTSTVKTSPEEVEHATISGLEAEYTNGDEATFTVDITDDDYAIESVSANKTKLTAEEGSSPAKYSFVVKGNTTVSISIKSTVAPTLEKTYDFTKLTETASELDATAALEKFNSCVSSDPTAKVTSVSDISKVYIGDTSTSDAPYASKAGYLKLGTSKVNGSITLVLNNDVSKVIISCHDWFAKSDSYPTNDRPVTVNEVKKDLPYNEAATPEDVEFELKEASKTITISSTKRALIFGITFVVA